jgi:RecA-family ATPase
MLCEKAKDIRPRFIGIDNAADVYTGNENDRAQVRKFLTMLRKLAIEASSTVVLTSRPQHRHRLIGLDRLE